jgi:putative phage-type endonuclease
MRPFEIDPGQARVILPADASYSEWVAERRNGIGGSDIAAAVGVSPYETPYQLWAVKTGRVDPELFIGDEERERFRWGHLLEPVIRDAFAEDNPHLTVTTGAGTYALPDAKHHRVNVDGLAWSPDGCLDGVIEIKTGNHRQRQYWEGDEAPVHYVAQCQWAMHITGAARTYLVGYIDNEYIQKEIPRDDDLITDLAEIADEFWHRVETDNPPPVDSSDTTRRMLAATHTEEGSVIELDHEWARDLRRHELLTEQIRNLVDERNEIANRLRAAMGEAEAAVLDGEIVATHKRPKPSRRVCTRTLQEQFPDVYARVATPTTASRRLVFK